MPTGDAFSTDGHDPRLSNEACESRGPVKRSPNGGRVRIGMVSAFCGGVGGGGRRRRRGRGSGGRQFAARGGL